MIRSLEHKLTILLQQCTLPQLKQIHAQIITFPHQNPNLISKFLRRSTEFGSMSYPNQICTHLGTPNTTLFNAMIRGYAYNGPFEMCLKVFDEMPERGLTPNNFTYPYVFDCCVKLGWFGIGEKVHCCVVKSGFQGAIRVSESLFGMYVELSGVGDARKVFDEMCERSVVVWNKMVYGYVGVGDVGRARRVFDDMLCRDVVSWNTMISGYATVGDAVLARDLFEQMPARNVVSWTSMIAAYANAGDVEAARGIFIQMPHRNVVSWNSMITCLEQNGEFEEVLRLFVRMQSEGIDADGFTFVSVLSACAHLGALEFGRWVNSLIIDWSEMSVKVGTALLEMYAKCGDVEKAFTIFIKIGNKDVFCWNVTIKSLAIHGRAKDALELFFLMQSRGLKPNGFTFSSALFACSHGGLVEEGQIIFDSMEKQFGVTPKLEHYGCMIDLLSRNDQLEKAESLVKEMPFEPDGAILGALVGGRGATCNFQLAEQVIKDTNVSNEEESGIFVSLSNMYASNEQWTEAMRARQKMERKRIQKGAAQSCVQ